MLNGVYIGSKAERNIYGGIPRTNWGFSKTTAESNEVPLYPPPFCLIFLVGKRKTLTNDLLLINEVLDKLQFL